MFSIEKYPYSNFHDMNLDWIIEKVRMIAAEQAELGQKFHDIETVVREKLKDILIEWKDDGTLDEIINQEIFGALNRQVQLNTAGDQMSAEKRQRYQQAIRTNLVSFLVRNDGGTYFANGHAITDPPIVYRYSNKKAWWSYRFGETPVYNETTEFKGRAHRILNIDCTAFTALVTANKAYLQSPYGVALAYHDVEELPAMADDIYHAGFTDMHTYNDIAMDFSGSGQTDRMFIQLSANGFEPLQLATHIRDHEPVINYDAIALLETGDIIESGRSPSPTDPFYDIINHCMVYVRSLEELNNTDEALANNIRFAAVDDGNPAFGYIVHVAGAPDQGQPFVDVLRINTLDYWLRLRPFRDADPSADPPRPLPDTYHVCYGFKASATSDNSNAVSHYSNAPIYRDGNSLFFPDLPRYTTAYSAPISMNTSTGEFKVRSIYETGISFKEGQNVDTLDQGTYYCTNAAIRASLTGTLPSSVMNKWFTVKVGGVHIGGRLYGYQLLYTMTSIDGNMEMWFRSVGNGNVSHWKPVQLGDPFIPG